jgi:hypothetical protein
LKSTRFFYQLQENKLLKLEELKKMLESNDSSIEIINSDLGKTSFINTNLWVFDKVIFANSKLSELFLGDTELPENIFTTENNKIQVQKKIFYEQAKKMYENNGNKIKSLLYGSKEMEVYRAQLSETEIKPLKGEKFQVWFNHFSNKHGTSWRRGLRVTLIISICFYILYCIFSFGIGSDFVKLFKLIPYYFNFINPVHKLDFLVDETNFKVENLKWNFGFALAIDFISRLVIPIFAYQMVQAFRKYGK